MDVYVTPEIKQVAQTLHRKRMLANQSAYSISFTSVLAEVAALAAYDRQPSINDVKAAPKSLQFVPRDDSGRSIRIIYRDSWPLLVASYRLDDADAFIFVKRGISADTLEISGWLPVYLVERAPIHWFEEESVRTGYAHEIDKTFVFDLPLSFDFVDPCGFGPVAHRDRTFNGVWDYGMESWTCFGCDNYLYDEAERERIIKLDERLLVAEGVEVSEEQTGD